MSLLYHNDTIIKKEKELLRALLGQFCKLIREQSVSEQRKKQLHCPI